MADLKSGKCNYCDKIVNKSGIKKHIASCKEKKSTQQGVPSHEKTKYFHLMVDGKYSPEYWLYLDVKSTTKLKALDDFLRQIWLECCGHLSAFRIRDQTYSSYPDKSFGDRSMNYKLQDLMGEGMTFGYEYDFGTSNELNLKVTSESEGKSRRKAIEVMARNTAPDVRCSACGKIATQVCAQCIWENKGWLCDKCGEVHKCGEEMLLPVVNSPRVGMCGYTGNGII